MGVALRRVSQRADALFRLADDVTGLSIGDLCARGPREELTRTEVAQVAIVATSLSAAAHLEELVGGPLPVAAVAGHSVGELAAMCWAGALEPEAALRLVHERGRLMERDSAACDGTMVAVLGLGAAGLEAVCARASAVSEASVQVANLNAPGQVVISGDRAAIAAASELALAAGARRVVPLVVGGPFHSCYLEAAAHDFHRLASTVPLSPPRVPIVLNANGSATEDPAALRDELSAQITAAVRWEDSVRTLAEMGCSEFVEIGPGQVLAGLVRRILPEARASAAGTPEAIAEVARRFRTLELPAGRTPRG